jgi:hypothetical protein
MGHVLTIPRALGLQTPLFAENSRLFDDSDNRLFDGAVGIEGEGFEGGGASCGLCGGVVGLAGGFVLATRGDVAERDGDGGIADAAEQDEGHDPPTEEDEETHG